MKRGKVYIKDVLCGIITESEEGYTFEYDKTYLNKDGATALRPPMSPKSVWQRWTGIRTNGLKPLTILSFQPTSRTATRS